MMPLARFATDYSKTVLIIVLLVTLGFASQLKNLQIDDEILNMIPVNHPARLLQERIEQEFGLRDLVILAIENPDGVFNPESLARIKILSDFLQSRPEIIAEDVTSLNTMDNVVGLNDELLIRPPLQQLPKNQSEAQSVYEEVQDNPLFINRLVSKDGKVIAIFAPISDDATRRSVYQSVNQYLSTLPTATNGDRILVSGKVMIEGALGFSMRSDLRRLGPVVVIVLLILLTFYFRHFGLSLLPIITALVSVIWTMGLLSVLKVPVYLPTTLIPVMLLVIGITDEVHLIGIYRRMGLEEERRVSLLKALKHIIRPITLTSITTAAGFIALSVSTIMPLKHFGLFTAFGIGVAYLLTFTLTPAYLRLMRRPKRWAQYEEDKLTSVEQRLVKWGTVLTQHPGKVALMLLLSGLVAAWGAAGTRVDENWVNRFKPGHELYESDASLNQALGGTTMLYSQIVTDTGALKDPDLLSRIAQLQSAISSLPKVGKVTSIVDLLKRSNRVLNNDDPRMEILPESKQAVAQQLLLLEASGDPNDLDVWIDPRQHRALLWIQLKDPYASSARALLPQLEQLARQYLPGVQVNFGGPAHVNVAMADMVVSSQLGSLGLSFCVVFLVLMVIYRSIRWTILALMPLTLSLLTVFAVLTLGGRYIDIPLAVLASISLGLAVDYAIYVLDCYRSARINGAQQVEATQLALVRSGSIVLLNSMILAAGLFVLVMSHFAPLTAIGLLTAGVLIISALVSLLLPLFAAGLPLNKTVTHQELGQ